MKNKLHVKDQYCAGPLCDCKPAAHTPTPWIIETDGPAGQTGSPDIVTTLDGAYVMAECSPSVCQVEPDEAIANAAFIVRAVNAHEELLAAAKEALHIFEMEKAFMSKSHLGVALNLHKAIACAERK